MRKPFAAMIVLMCCLLATGTVRAISFEPRDFAALAREADQVAIGTVTAINSRRTGEREIVTDFRFDQLEIVKGTLPTGSLTLTMLGGTVGAEALTVAGAPTFQLGVRYLVFVSGNGSAMFPLVGGQQGIFQMRRDAATGVSRVHDYAGRPVIRLPGAAGKSAVDLVRVDSNESISEVEFVDAIRAQLITPGAE